MSGDTEDRQKDRERLRFLAAIQEGLEDVEAGRVVDDEDLESALDVLDGD